MLFHFTNQLAPYLSAVPFAGQVAAAGWTGVELFFVLSGFVITRAYAEELGRPRLRSLVRFVGGRFARVWPAWAAVTLAMAGWLWAIREAGWAADLVNPHPAVDAPALLGQLAMTHMWGRDELAGASYVLPGWSISVEWAAYLAFPLLALLLRPLRRLPASVLLVLSVLAVSPLVVIAAVEGPYNSQLPWELRIACAFTAGALAALAVGRARRAAWEPFAAGAVRVIPLLVLLGILWAGWRRTMPGAGGDHVGVVVVLFPVLVAALALTERGLAQALSGRALVFGGRISYAVYLVHFVVLDVLLTVLWQDPAKHNVLGPGLALAAPFLVLGCFGLAAGLHRYVEEPGRRLVVRGLDRLLPVETVADDRTGRLDLRTLPPLPAARATVGPTT
ncbi:acyltransferase [Blastococcus sp. TML/M2B]|nr:acyltransferase [Blastococcus sp. TML/M2B]